MRCWEEISEIHQRYLVIKIYIATHMTKRLLALLNKSLTYQLISWNGNPNPTFAVVTGMASHSGKGVFVDPSIPFNHSSNRSSPYEASSWPGTICTGRRCHKSPYGHHCQICCHIWDSVSYWCMPFVYRSLAANTNHGWISFWGMPSL